MGKMKFWHHLIFFTFLVFLFGFFITLGLDQISQESDFWNWFLLGLGLSFLFMIIVYPLVWHSW